jgi:hypothetical protein
MMHYLSRAFVEFGPFSTEEMLSFQQRGLLKDTDYIRAEGTDVWTHVGDWQTISPDAPKLPSTKAKMPAAKPKAEPTKKVAAKKVAVKKSTKAA